MLRRLFITLLTIGLVVLPVATSLAEDKVKPTIVKVYKSPG